MRQLLQHTSGLPDYVAGLGEDFFAVRNTYFEPRDLLDLALKEPARFTPGERWEYSNTNYLLAGLLVQKVTGRPVAEEITQRILDPPRLRNTPALRSEFALDTHRAFSTLSFLADRKRAPALFRHAGELLPEPLPVPFRSAAPSSPVHPSRTTSPHLSMRLIWCDSRLRSQPTSSPRPQARLIPSPDSARRRAIAVRTWRTQLFR
ncbi:serine hydrolase domain-containing protein [Streptomyces olivaceoviridis]|uniref:serine hydrolase domain-containing protein n=1 Tax=Streptomyces olivaceoviridis TaxID=1921 RepID=UPI0036AEDBB9